MSEAMHDLPAPVPIAERPAIAADRFASEVFDVYEPVVLRGQVAHWPAVAAAREGDRAMAEHIAAFDRGNPVEVMIGAPEIGGRFFYRDDMRGFNFHREQVPVGVLLQELLRLAGDPAPPALYAGAAAAGAHLPGWTAANAIDLPVEGATPRVWIGNATCVSTHFDTSPNLACVVAGTRRFLMFPPDQISNLHIGPIDVTMAGQPASMVDPDAPDLDRYPRFAEAMAHARVAELGPGDAIFMPALWWHHVRARGTLNVLVNYWWDAAAQASPLAALAHALLAIRELPAGERDAWRGWFGHYVFDDAAPHVADHLPEFARSVLGSPSAARDDRLRAFLRNALS
ncbi:cupin-like domain-containing protein [Sphingomonas japonica]|uniref:JmjC domain-containing protein n=1 Tax=Sphingomonas japonica TaxID=511662 RepID=A0ABX0TXT3_9SPHN|nr:cupin-like domain-containing protein [Sphingomonas japonica]NIJ23038.1 hypothetical protein [Sphingomonas japonica]